MRADVVLADFFSGCGGTTLGFADAGMAPALAIDWEPDAAATFKLNFPTTAVIEQDIRELGVDEVGAVQAAPTLTTTCISYRNRRFRHPSQDRALSARVAAGLQTFPASFQFAGSLTSQAKRIGNAVPALLARHFGHHLVHHVADAMRSADVGVPGSSLPVCSVSGT